MKFPWNRQTPLSTLPKVACAFLKLLDSVFWKSIINTRLLLISDAYFEGYVKFWFPGHIFFNVKYLKLDLVFVDWKKEPLSFFIFLDPCFWSLIFD